MAADGTLKVHLYWSGLPGQYVDVYRNNTKVLTTNNDGYRGDTLPTKTLGTYSYFLCSSGTATCTATASVTF